MTPRRRLLLVLVLPGAALAAASCQLLAGFPATPDADADADADADIDADGDGDGDGDGDVDADADADQDADGDADGDGVQPTDADLDADAPPSLLALPWSEMTTLSSETRESFSKAMSLPRPAAGACWLVLASGALQVTGDSGARDASVTVDVTLGGVSRALGGIGRPTKVGPFQQFFVECDMDAAQDVEVHSALSGIAPVAATLDLRVVAVQLPAWPDPVDSEDDDADHNVDFSDFQALLTLEVTPHAAGDYLVLAAFSAAAGGADGTAGVFEGRIVAPGGELWPVSPLRGSSCMPACTNFSNDEGTYRSFFVARREHLEAGATSSYSIQAKATGGSATIARQHLVAIPVDLFSYADDSITPEYRAFTAAGTYSLTPPLSVPASGRYLVMHTVVLGGASATINFGGPAVGYPLISGIDGAGNRRVQSYGVFGLAEPSGAASQASIDLVYSGVTVADTCPNAREAAVIVLGL